MPSGPSETEKNGPREQEVSLPSEQAPLQRTESAIQRMTALSRSVVHLVMTSATRVAATVRAWIARFAAVVVTAARTTKQRVRDWVVLLPLRVRSHLRQRRELYVRLGASFVLIITLAGCWTGIGFWPTATRYCAHLSPSTFEQVAVALGASISGLLAIVFALTTFAIQQVAAREAAEVVLEYAGDRRMASTYWMLAAIATICFALPFVHLPQDFLPTELVSFGALLTLTFLLIYRHFKIVMLYSDPRFTVDRLDHRGMRELRTVAQIVNRVKRAIPNTGSENQ